MDRQDELFVQGLRARADATAPRIDVDVDRVVPRARRRRRVVRGAAGATTLALVLGATWGASAVLGVGPVRDVGPADRGGAPSPTSPVVPAEAVVARDGTVTGVPGDPWSGDEPYWYELVEVVGADGGIQRSESWTSRERPGLLMSGGDVTRADAVGPVVALGSFVLDGRRYDTLTDPRVLPVDPAVLERVLRASVEPGRRQGTDDDKVVSMVYDSLREGALLPAELRDAFWRAALLVPGVEAVPGESRGRAAEVMTYRNVGTGGGVRLVRDPATGLLLESGWLDGPGAVVLEQRPSGPPPVDPVALVGSGCAEWRQC